MDDEDEDEAEEEEDEEADVVAGDKEEQEEEAEEEAALSVFSSLVRDLRVSRYSCWLAASTWARMSASALEYSLSPAKVGHMLAALGCDERRLQDLYEGKLPDLYTPQLHEY